MAVTLAASSEEGESVDFLAQPGGEGEAVFDAPIGSARERFSVKFYMVAMLFILFDVEAVFLYPWAILLRELKMFGFWEMLVYIGIVLVGFFYIWKKGVLDWSTRYRGKI